MVGVEGLEPSTRWLRVSCSSHSRPPGARVPASGVRTLSCPHQDNDRERLKSVPVDEELPFPLPI